jgi:iron complex outermembrane recepter protein
MKKRVICRRQVAFAVSSVFGTALIFALSLPGALAQEKVERVEITGSNIKRIPGETALPVQIISREDIERTGATTVEQFINSVGVTMQGNNNSVAATASGATSGGVSGISLRGLGSQRTLVLINGRRVAPGGTITDSVTVDINTIPLAAVDRIEILKDGASAIYGSDAIAGVVNFILRSNYSGAEVTGYVGASEHGGGGVKRANAMYGFGDFGENKYNVTLFASFQKEEALFGRQRDFANSGINAANDTTSGNTFPANVALLPIPGHSSRNPSNPACPGPFATFDPNTDIFGTKVCRFDPSPMVALLPEIKQTNLYGTGRFAITSNMEGYAELGFNHKESRTIIQPVPLSDQFALPFGNPLFFLAPYNAAPDRANSTIILKSTSPFYPTAFANAQFGGTPDLLVRWRDNINGNRDLTDITQQTRVVLGVKGTAAGWDYDAGFMHNQTKLAEQLNNGFPLQSEILPILNSGQVNFFGQTPANVESQVMATGFLGDAYRIRASTDSFTVKGSRELMQLAAGPLAIAVGAEERKEGFIVNPSTAIQQGDIAGYGGNFLPVDKTRNVTALWFEGNVPIVRNLEATGAVRYDNYQNVGNKTTPKASVRWQPERGLLLRASWGKGFRAPSLTELFTPLTQGVSAPGLSDPARCPTTGSSIDCATQFTLQLGGNPNLRPEESTNKTFGVVIEPNDRISLGLTAWSVNLTNTIIFGVQPSAILANPAAFPGFITRGPVDPAFPALPGPITQILSTDLNLGKTEVSGLDIDVKGRFPATGWGTFSAGLAGTMIMKYRIQNPDGTFTSIKGMVSPIANGAGGVIPEWRHYAYVDLKTANWDHTLSQNYQSGYTDIVGTIQDNTVADFKPNIVKYYSVYNFQTAFTGFKSWRLAAGIRNLFDTKPPYTNAGGQNWFQAGYDPGYVDPRGRFFYTTVTYKFK